ncbi:hypothetical protein [Methylobacterium mesophilicum]|uniref:hypothetical protein n=1 Tax=Methylobacterium mesophilicum TaxID=39956 RepID=UPI002F2EFFC4
MPITTSINVVGPVAATQMIQSARAEAALEHRAGLHTVTMPVPKADDPGITARQDDRLLPASQERVVDITV